MTLHSGEPSSVPPAPPVGNLAAVRPIELPSFTDARGTLTAAEGEREIPFPIRRAYWLSDLRDERGNHAHRRAELVQVAVAGSFTVEIRDPVGSRSFHLDRPSQGLYIPPLLWIRLHSPSPDARVLILASSAFEECEVIRTWQEYRDEATVAEEGPPEARRRQPGSVSRRRRERPSAPKNDGTRSLTAR